MLKYPCGYCCVIPLPTYHARKKFHRNSFLQFSAKLQKNSCKKFPAKKIPQNLIQISLKKNEFFHFF